MKSRRYDDWVNEFTNGCSFPWRDIGGGFESREIPIVHIGTFTKPNRRRRHQFLKQRRMFRRIKKALSDSGIVVVMKDKLGDSA